MGDGGALRDLSQESQVQRKCKQVPPPPTGQPVGAVSSMPAGRHIGRQHHPARPRAWTRVTCCTQHLPPRALRAGPHGPRGFGRGAAEHTTRSVGKTPSPPRQG